MRFKVQDGCGKYFFINPYDFTITKASKDIYEKYYKFIARFKRRYGFRLFFSQYNIYDIGDCFEKKYYYKKYYKTHSIKFIRNDEEYYLSFKTEVLRDEAFNEMINKRSYSNGAKTIYNGRKA